MSKRQLTALEALTGGSRIVLDKVNSVAFLSYSFEKVNLLTFHALRNKGLIELDESAGGFAHWRISPAGLKALRDEQKKVSSVV